MSPAHPHPGLANWLRATWGSPGGATPQDSLSNHGGAGDGVYRKRDSRNIWIGRRITCSTPK